MDPAEAGDPRRGYITAKAKTISLMTAILMLSNWTLIQCVQPENEEPLYTSQIISSDIRPMYLVPKREERCINLHGTSELKVMIIIKVMDKLSR
jgi:hypothetical protein